MTKYGTLRRPMWSHAIRANVWQHEASYRDVRSCWSRAVGWTTSPSAASGSSYSAASAAVTLDHLVELGAGGHGHGPRGGRGQLPSTMSRSALSPVDGEAERSQDGLRASSPVASQPNSQTLFAQRRQAPPRVRVQVLFTETFRPVNAGRPRPDALAPQPNRSRAGTTWKLPGSPVH